MVRSPAETSAAPKSVLTRGALLKRVSLGTAAVSAAGVGAAALASAQGGGRLTQRDRKVLRFALELELLQSAFYAAALKSGKLTGEVRQFVETVGHEEEAHRKYVEKLLGGSAGIHPRFNIPAASDNRSFLDAAVKLEDTGLAAYNGQAGNLSRGALAQISRVISVEARHASWVRDLAGQQPAPHATDAPISASQALTAIRPYLA